MVPDRLLKAIERAEESLRNILQDNRISIIYVSDQDSLPMRDYKEQWEDQGTYKWKKHLETFSSEKPIFTVAVYYDDNTLCGLLELEEVKRRFFKKRLEINCIEGSPKQHPLKGKIIATFSQVTLDIAKEFNFGFIGVFFPKKQTVPSYLALGFKRTSLGVEKRIDQTTNLNWQQYLTERNLC